MSSNNQNFIIGVISATALVIGLIYYFFSIYKTNLEIRKLRLEKNKQKKTQINNLTSSIHNDFLNLLFHREIVFDVLCFFIFSLASINAILSYLANTVPKIALVATQFIVLVYSFFLLINNSKVKSQQNNKKELIFSKFTGCFGLIISITFTFLIGLQRVTPILISTSNSDNIIPLLFPLLVNFSIAPLLLFSLVSLDRIYKYVSKAVSERKKS